MSLESAAREGRRMAESLMVDECSVHSVVSVGTDDLTGADVPVYAPMYAGRCRMQAYDGRERSAEAGGLTATVQRYAVHVPVGSFEPVMGQVVTITRATLDPHLAGRKFRVTELLHKTAATAYRLGVEEV